MYRTAMRKASSMMWKQSPGVAGARIGSGLSELRPYIAASRSACSVFVGMPVEGPARWMLTITTGSSAITARPTASCFRMKPGPLVVEMARWPA